MNLTSSGFEDGGIAVMAACVGGVAGWKRFVGIVGHGIAWDWEVERLFG